MKDKNIALKLNFLILAISGLSSFIFSLYIGNLYIDGDQIYYKEAYSLVKGLDLVEGFLSYRSQISSEEPIHFLFVWVFSNFGVDKNVLMSVVNSFFIIILTKLLLKWRVFNFIIFATIVTNFYILVLFFSAERLKFSIIFLLLSVLLIEKKKTSLFFTLLSVLTHTQTSLMIIANSFGLFMSNLFKAKKSIFSSLNLGKIFAIIIFGAIFLFLKDHLFSKFSSYSEITKSKSFIANSWQSIIFLLFSLWYSRNKLETFFVFIVIIFSASLVGSDRITILAYFFFMYNALKINRGFNLGVLLSIIYFGFKSTIFLTNIFNNGHGF
jgi:hypothetical protein